MTERQQALLGYFSTIVSDPRVRKAIERQSVAEALSAAEACFREDLGAVGSKLLDNAGKMFAERMAPMAAMATGLAVEEVFGVLGKLFGGGAGREPSGSRPRGK